MFSPRFSRVSCALAWIESRDLQNDAVKDSIFCRLVGISLSQIDRNDSIFFRTDSAALLSICVIVGDSEKEKVTMCECEWVCLCLCGF